MTYSYLDRKLELVIQFANEKGMTERLSSLHDPYNGCVDLQHNYSDNRD